MEWQKANRESAVNTYNSLGKLFSDDGALPEKGLRFVIEENKKIVKVSREVSLSEVADLSILKQAQDELRVRQP